MTIKDVELLLDISRANVRFYEKEGLLKIKRNPVNGYREYSDRNIEDLKKILFLRDLDVSIEDIRLIQNGEVFLKDIILKQKDLLKTKQQKFDYSRRMCTYLLNLPNLDYDTFSLEFLNDHLSEDKSEGAELIRDCSNETANYGFFHDDRLSHVLGLIKEYQIQIFLLLLTILSGLLAVVVFPLLPSEVRVQWSYISTTSMWKGWVFLFPIISASILLLLKDLTEHWFYQNLTCYIGLCKAINLSYVFCIMAMTISFTFQVYFIFGIEQMGFPLLYFLVLEFLFFILGTGMQILLVMYKSRKSATSFS